jgi:hypothetical protein
MKTIPDPHAGNRFPLVGNRVLVDGQPGTVGGTNHAGPVTRYTINLDNGHQEFLPETAFILAKDVTTPEA